MGRKTRFADQKTITENPQVAYISETGEWIKARTENQKTYINAIRQNDLTVGIGPAGTGKTFLATAVGIQELKNGKVERIVITRPIVEAGEKLGYLPGSMEEKINPYLRPIYDALGFMIGPQETQMLIEAGTIEIAPLAYMRGRTLENSFIILDEAQNTTIEQLEMLLTRMGLGSKVVVTGDITQIDLPKRDRSGLLTLHEILGNNNIPGLAFQFFTEADVVRHPLVREIVKCYEAWKAKKEQQK